MARNDGVLFTFENIVFLSDRDLLCLLKEVDNVTLLQACKQCDELVLQRINKQFSQLARDYFYDDLLKIGNVRSSEVMAAQNKIGRILGQLYLSGKIIDWDISAA